MSTMISPVLTATSWTRVPTLTVAARVTIQPRNAAPIAVYIGTDVPSMSSPFFSVGENLDVHSFDCDLGDSLWLRYLSPMTASGPGPVVRVRGL